MLLGYSVGPGPGIPFVLARSGSDVGAMPAPLVMPIDITVSPAKPPAAGRLSVPVAMVTGFADADQC